jgi:tight adherence protein C
VSEATGGWLGLLTAVGLLLVLSRLPVVRRPPTLDRVLPYLRDLAAVAPAPLGSPTPGVYGVVARAAAVRDALADRLDRFLGGSDTVRRRLDQCGGGDVADFRARQVVWAGTSAAVVLALGLFRAMLGAPPAPVVLVLLAATSGAFGAWACDQQLARRATRACRQVVVQLPVAAELMALAVGAGEGPAAALARVAGLCGGELGRDLSRVLADVRAGAPMAQAMGDYASRSDVAAVRRFADAFVVALERGTPLAAVLRAQATDAREAARVELTERAASREVLMLLPVVFLVLPITVLFALFPGFWGLALNAA